MNPSVFKHNEWSAGWPLRHLSSAVIGFSLSGCINGVPKATEAAGGYVRCEAGKIEDAEDGDNQVINHDGRGGYWFTSVDTAGSELAQPKFAMSVGGANGSKHAARMAGKLAPSGKSIYAVLGFAIANPKAPYDASHYSAVSFWAKGPGLVSFKAADINTEPMGDRCTDCYNKFGADIYLSEQWTRYTVPFDKLKQAPGWGDPAPAVAAHALFALEWHVSKAGAAFDFAVDDIEFVGCQSPDQKPRDFEYMGPRLNAEHAEPEATAAEAPNVPAVVEPPTTAESGAAEPPEPAPSTAGSNTPADAAPGNATPTTEVP